MTPLRRRITRALASERLVQHVRVDAGGGRELLFDCPTARSLMDPLSFEGNEPETLEWIDGFETGRDIVFWDIGANIGTFSLYAALRPNVLTYAFEPSAASFASLARNIELNRMGERILPFCLALADRTGIDFLHMANSGAGHATHAFGTRTTIDGAIAPVFSQATPGMTADSFREVFEAPQPDHIKLDVDSIETSIIRGGAQTFRQARTVMVEAYNSAREPQTGVFAALEELGFEADDDFNRGRWHNHLFRNKAFG